MDRHRPLSGRAIPVPIIALALLVAAALSVPTRAAADVDAGPGETPLALPALGNTAETDRPLLQEIGDEHVHDPTPAVPHGVAVGRGASDGRPSGVPGGMPGGAAGRAADGAAVGAADGAADGATDRAADGATPRPASATDDAWARVRASRRLIVPDEAGVRAQMRRFRDQRSSIGRILRRGNPYVAHVVAALDERYLPLELALLPAIESGFRPDASSPDTALGLWQLMPLTAREIGVRRSPWYDGRADTVEATTAALDYLSYLNAVFHGDWELTLAAYNAGPGRVRRAVGGARAAGEPADFWSLPLPRETREYVPKFLALVALLRGEPGDALEVPHVPMSPAFVKVETGRRISVGEAAALAGLPDASLARLNAGLRRGVTPPDGPHELYVPPPARSRLLAALARTAPPGAGARTHTVVAGDTLSGIALAYGIGQARLRELNGLDGSRILAGQSLALVELPRGGTAAGRSDGVAHVVAPGDTLSDIARRYAVGVEAIRREDGGALDDELIHPGDTLRVRLPPPDAG